MDPSFMTNEEFLAVLPPEERDRNFWTQSLVRRFEKLLAAVPHAATNTDSHALPRTRK